MTVDSSVRAFIRVALFGVLFVLVGFCLLIWQAKYAIRAIGRIGDPSQNVMEALQFAIHSPDVVGRDYAVEVHEMLVNGSPLRGEQR